MVGRMGRRKEIGAVVWDEVGGWRGIGLGSHKAKDPGPDGGIGQGASTVSVVDVEAGFPGTTGDVECGRKAKPFYFIVTGKGVKILLRKTERDD